VTLEPIMPSLFSLKRPHAARIAKKTAGGSLEAHSAPTIRPLER
jgi:hypothetical protein